MLGRWHGKEFDTERQAACGCGQHKEGIAGVRIFIPDIDRDSL
jgi:hypothetical protein